MRSMRRAIGPLAVIVAAMLPLCACGSASDAAHAPVTYKVAGHAAATHAAVAHPAAAQRRPAPAPAPAQAQLGANLVGYSTPNFPHSLTPFRQLEKQTGIHADIASWYTPMSQNFDRAEVAKISAQGALPLIEIDSDATPLTQVATGKWDKHFIAYARAVAAYRSPIAIDFDHEFNAPWYKWGYKHTSAAAFVAAWRRIVWLFRKFGARNVIWIWNPNVSMPATTALKPWYPGNQWVTYVGLDGYFLQPSQTFGAVFGPTLRQVSAFTSKRVFITETGANPGKQRVTQINSLFAGLEATPRIAGFIWFDYYKYAGHDWLLEGDKPALKAFHADARGYQK